MYEELDDPADSIRVWRDSQLPHGSLCSKCLEVHGLYAPCIPSSLPADAVPLPPPRLIKSGFNGSLSLHDYRKYLSQSAECVDDPVDRSERTLKRKTAKSNLNPPQPLSSLSSLSPRAVSVSSAASSPPPLSPSCSCSHSVISHQSEQESDTPETQPGALLIPIYNPSKKNNKALTLLQFLSRVHECTLSRKAPPVQDLTGSDW